MASPNKNVSVNLRENKMNNTNFNINDAKYVSISAHSTGGTHYHNMAASTSARRRINNCLPPISTFVGREDDLKRLTELVEEHRVVALVGMGGLGKTQLARKFSTINVDKYSNCMYWLAAETSDILRKSFLQLADELGVVADINGRERDANTILKNVYARFSEGQSLLVFDNVEKRDDIYPYLPTTLGVQQGANLHILITSRRKNWSQDKILTVPLVTLSCKVALVLFREIFGEEYGKTSADEWKKLAELLGYLPLAIQVAASYIKYFGVSVSEYIDKLKKDTYDLLVDPLPEYENRSIYISMMMTLELLEKRKGRKFKLAVKLINTAAYMNPEWICQRFLLPLVDKDDKESVLDEALTILTEFSLFNQGFGWIREKNYTIHRIIQTSIQHHQSEQHTADIYYIEALKSVESYAANLYSMTIKNHKLAEISNTFILQYAAERASAIVDYYNLYPTSPLLLRLVEADFTTAMIAVSEKMKINQFQSLIEQYSLLHFAVQGKNLPMAQLLYVKGADVNLPDRRTGRSPLYCACQVGNIEIVKWLLQNKASATSRDKEGHTALHRAAKLAQCEIVSTIIETDRDTVNLSDDEGNTPLLDITYKTSKELEETISTIQVLFDNGADMAKANMCGNTVLHIAARDIHVSAVALILKLNKDLINRENNKGQTALHVISKSIFFTSEVDRFRQIAEMLIKNGLSVYTQDKQGCTSLETINPAFKDILQQVADECKDRPMIKPAKRPRNE